MDTTLFVLLVDDNPEDRAAVAAFLEEACTEQGISLSLAQCQSGEDGLAAFNHAVPDCILLDHHLPDMDGLDFIERLKTKAGELPAPVVMFTGSGDPSLPRAALQAGAHEYMPKRFMGPEMLLRSVHSARDRFGLLATRLASEAALAKSAARLRMTQEAGQIGNWDWEDGSEDMLWSAETCLLHGIASPAERTERPVGHADWVAMIHPDDRAKAAAAILDAMATSAAYQIEYRIVLADGSIRWLGGRGMVMEGGAGQPRRLLGVTHDITAARGIAEQLAHANDVLELRVLQQTTSLFEEGRRRLETEAQLHQAQKMEAIGQLTGGIAHDFNNVLQVIIGNVELVRRQLEGRHGLDGQQTERVVLGAVRSMDKALKASRSAAHLTSRLLTFGRRQMLLPVELDVNQLVGGMTDMIRRTLGGMIVAQTVLAGDLWPTLADANQLEAALLNLVINARDAMPDGGRLTIATENLDLQETIAGPLGEATPGRYVLLSVSDTGSGIPAAMLAHIFEPFFTTKAAGSGTGLGLSMVAGFVKQSAGHIDIETAVGRGTTVRIYLRHALTVAGIDRAAPTTRAIDAAALPRARAGETVLIVGDEETVRLYLQEALEDLGYRVLTAVDATTASARLEAPPATGIDLLLADITPPGSLDRDELGRRWPELPVLLMTGWGQDTRGPQGGPDTGIRCLDTTYSFETLARRVRGALDAAPVVASGRP